MPVSEKRFSGIMNLDDANDVLPSSHHNDAHNVVFRGNGNNQIVQNINGTRLVNNPFLHSGTNIVIGTHYDSLKNRLFYFVHNIADDDLNYDAIFMYDVNANSVSKLLMSYVDSSEQLFNFNTQYPVASVNILYRTEEEGDILYWTDGLNRPKKLNILEATSSPKKYGSNWMTQYLTVSRYVPQNSPICKYNDDISTNINNLKNKIFQFAYRWIYMDNTKSTFSPWCRMFTPVDVDSLATEIDPTKNNVINVDYETGAADVKAIEIIARNSISDTYSDAYSVIILDKSSLGISDDTTGQYNFYNSQAYQFLDPVETTLLYSLVPIKANSQELLNGNQVIYGGITEGKTLDTVLNVTTSVDLIQNVSSANLVISDYDKYTFFSDPPRIHNGFYYIIVSGNPQTGDVYNFDVSMIQYTDYDYIQNATGITITVSDLAPTLQSVQNQIFDELTANSVMFDFGLDNAVFILDGGADPYFPGAYGVRIAGNLSVNSWITDVYNYQYTYAPSPTPADPTGINTSCYKHNARYGFGLVYYDEYGETNGVNTTSSMNFITPEITVDHLGIDAADIPALSFSINHAPPTWATSYTFVRTIDLTYANFFTIFTDTTSKDTDYGYLDITSFQTNTDSYVKYDFAKGDRVRLVGKKNAASATIVPDYPILDLLTKNPVTTNDGQFIKVQYDSTTMSTFGTDNEWYLEVYTPSINTSTSNTQVYYEFGETYQIGTDVNDNRVHLGQTQDQIIGVGEQPATFTFFRGDRYERQRNNLWIIDPSLSDKFLSKIIGNGRPLVVDPSAKETYYPTLVRYSLTYSQGTVINETNIFYPANYDEYDRSRGDIRRLKVRGGSMRVYQSRGVGNVGVLENLIYNADGSDNLIQTNKIINQIHYYQGNYGMGWMNTSLASSAGADYFVDPVRGYQLRVSQDGITPISELYKAQYYMTNLATKYNKQVSGNLGGYAKVLGTYDYFEEQYIAVFQASYTFPNITLAFDEARNCYTTFYDYAPEAISSIEGKVVSFKSGQIYVHDDTINYNRFYGTQYGSSITFVFNDQNMMKKDFNAITQDCDEVWTSPNVGDVNTSIGQESNLISSDYLEYEGLYNAAFMRDSNSLGGLIEGDYLKGTWLEAKLSNTSTNLVYLSGLYINYTLSQRNG